MPRVCELCRVTHDALWEWDLASGTVRWTEGAHPEGDEREGRVESITDRMARVHPEDAPRILGSIERAMRDGDRHWRGEYRTRRADGSHAFVQDHAHVVRDDAGQAIRVIGAMTDLTERRRVEERLIEQAELVDGARDAIVVRDLDGRIRYLNRGAEELYGWARAEAIGADVRRLQLAEAVEAFERANEATIARGHWSGDLVQVRRDGTSVLVEARWSLLRRPDGEPYGVLAVDSDVTERRRLEQHLMRAQRLESLGTLASGVAHDLNNILTPILVSIELLQGDEQDPSRIADLATLAACAQRGQAMVRQLLTFARGYAGEMAEVVVDDVIAEVARIVGDTFPKTITLRVPARSRERTVLGDATQIHQVLMNLCVNARDAMPAGGVLSLEVERVDVDDVYAGMNPGARPGPHVAINVVDSGCGMTAEVLERVFEPFFTTKEQGRGTGLGLSITHAIVRSHGGFIQASSTPGKGSVFRVLLPEAKPASEPASAWRTEPGMARGRGERVLVVDDEEAIRMMVQRTLERFGYRVLTASHGAEAVALFASHRPGIDLVLTDMAMPIMDGNATISALRTLDADVPIVCSSGLEVDGDVSRLLARGIRHIIAKPYTAQVLLRVIRRALDESGRTPSASSPLEGGRAGD